MARITCIAILGGLALAACGDDSGSTRDDAALGADDAAIDGAVCTMGNADHPTFWPTLCDAADTCGWLTGGHPELESDEASCNVRHDGQPDPSSQLAYLADFETRVHAAAACLGCQALLDAYFRPDLEAQVCGHLVRCGYLTDIACHARYQTDIMRPGTQAKFDYVCPIYCIQQLADDAACSSVMACAAECS